MKFIARIYPQHLRDTDGCDPKVLLKGVLIQDSDNTIEFRDHCYVSINKNKELAQYLTKKRTRPLMIGFKAKPFTYKDHKQSLCRIKDIQILEK